MDLQKIDLIGKVALITGGTRGICRGVAQRLASRGCSLLITCSTPASLTHVASLQSDIDKIFGDNTRGARPSVTRIVADFYKHDCAGKVADDLYESFDDRVYIVILNAAAAYATFVGQLDAKQVSESLFANIQTNAFIVDELVKRWVFQRDSRIIFVSSVRDRVPWKGQLMYAAGKAAGESVCRTWAEAFGGKHEEVGIVATCQASVEIYY